jgi:hypothetical protein
MFPLSNLWWNQSEDDTISFSQFWLQIKYDGIFLDVSFYIFGYLLEPWKYESGFKFGVIMAIENFKNRIILESLIFI